MMKKILRLTFTLLFISGVSFAQDEKSEPESNDELAKKLANPNATLGQMAFQFDYLSYSGNLPNAGGQSSFALNFQPSLPIPLSKEVNLFVRPNIPIYFSQPTFGANGFENAGFNLGNISADVAVGKTWPSKFIGIVGVFGSFRTATDDALKSNFTMVGPELMVAQVFKWGVLGAMFNHAWSTKSIDADPATFTTLTDDMWAAHASAQSTSGESASVTAGQYFYVINLKNAWQITGQPTWSYNHKADKGSKLTLPIGTGFNKVVRFGKLPLKIGAQYWYYVAQNENFGPKHQIRFSIIPIIPLPW